MEEGPIPQVLEIVPVVGERGEPDPLGPFATHLGHADLVTAPVVVQRHHGVAADAEANQLVVVGTSRDVVRATRAEERCPDRRGVRLTPDRARQERQPLAPARTFERAPGMLGQVDPARQHRRDHLGGYGSGRRHERAPDLVGSPDDDRLMLLTVEGLLQLGLDERRLILDDQDLVDTAHQLAEGQVLDRPRHPDADQPDAELVQVALGQPQVRQRPKHGGERQSGRHDGEARLVRFEMDDVEPGMVGVLTDAGQTEGVETSLGIQRLRADKEWLVHLASEVWRWHEGLGVFELHRRGPVGNVGHDLQCDPGPRISGKGHGVEAQCADLRHRGRRQEWDEQAPSHLLTGRGDRGRLAGRVVANDRDGAAEGRGARVVAVPDGVGGPVETGVLAVPEPRDPVVSSARQLPEQLTPGHRRGRQLLVQPRAKDDPGLIEQGRVALQLDVEAAERRALVAAHEGCRVEAAGPVQPSLVEHQPNESFNP